MKTIEPIVRTQKWDERRAREQHELALAMAKAGAFPQGDIVQAIDRFSDRVVDRLDEMIEIMREWQLEDAESSLDVN